MADYAKSQQKLKEATAQLEAGIKDFFQNGNYPEYLKVMSRFHTYSYSNSMMIALQKPDATLLAGFSSWKKHFKRHVLPNEHGIRIFAPTSVNMQKEQEKRDPDTQLPVLDENGDPVMETVVVKIPRYKVVYIFDVSQTDGEALPSLDIPELTASVQGYKNLFTAIEHASQVPIIFGDLQNDVKGYFSITEQSIHIQEGMSDAQTIKTAIHELAHSRLHNIDPSLSPLKQKLQKDRNTKEVEAESVAYVVCQHFGIDTSDYSFGYVATWSENRELPELKASLNTIQKAAASIIDDMEETLNELQITQTEELDQISELLPDETLSSADDPSRWKCYVIPDLLSWARPDLSPERTELEMFNSPEDAFRRFRELQKDSATQEVLSNEQNHLPYARLTLGIQREEPASAADLLHLCAGKKVLVDDFTRMDAIKQDSSALEIISEIGSRIGFDQVLVNRHMTDEEIKTFTYEHFKYQLEQNQIPYIEQYLSEFQQIYEEGQLDHLKPSKNQQQITELQEFNNWENPYFTVTDTPERLAYDLDSFITFYDPYMSKDSVETLTEAITNGDVEYLQNWLKTIIQEEEEFCHPAQLLSDRLTTLAPSPAKEQQAEITFYTAECMEFPNLGELHEGLTLQEALDYYEKIPADRMSAIKGIGFELHDGSDYDSMPYPLMQLGKIQTELLDMVPYYKNHPLVLQAIADLQTAMHLDEEIADLQSYNRSTDTLEAVYQVEGKYLHIQESSDCSWDYTLYNRFDLNSIDGGQIGDENMSFHQARSEIMEMCSIPEDTPMTEIEPDTFSEMLEHYENNLHCPVYPHDLKTARANGEMENWRISHNANRTCSEQFQQEYEHAYSERNVPEFLREMVDRYGMERCKLVIASTIQLSSHDGRYSNAMKEAASQITVPGTNSDPVHDRRFEYRVDCHPVTVNVAMRDLLAMEQKQLQALASAPPVKKRTSIRAKLEKNKAIIASGGKQEEPAKREKPQL